MAFREKFEKNVQRTVSKSSAAAAASNGRSKSLPPAWKKPVTVTAMRSMSRPNANTPLLAPQRTVSHNNMFAPGARASAIYTPVEDTILVDETKDLSNESLSLSNGAKKPHWSEYQPHYPCLYKVTCVATTIFGAVPAVIGECTFGLFSYKYAALGTKIAIDALGGNADNIIVDGLSEVVGFAAGGSEILNGVTQFELEEVPITAQDVDTLVHDIAQNGVCAPLCHFVRNTFSSPYAFIKTLYIGGSYGLFLFASAATSYGDIEDVKDRAQDWFTEDGGNAVLCWLGGGAMFYCVKAFLNGTKDGMQFLMEPNFSERYQNHHNPLIECQYIIEGGTAITYRTFILSFLLGRLAEQWGLDASLFYTLGGAAGLAQGLQFFLPKSHSKIHLYVDAFPEGEEQKSITQEERNAVYHDKYDNMGSCQRAWIEFKRAFMIGVAQSGVTLYFLVNEVMPRIVDAIKNDDRFIEDENMREAIGYGVFGLVGASATLLAYAPHWCANVYAECNELAYQRRKIPALAEVTVEPAQDIQDKTEEKQSRCQRWTGIGASFVSQVTRVPALVASLVNNKKIGPFLSKPHWTIVGGTIGTLVGYNRYNRMTESSIKGIHSFNNFVSSVPGKIRGWCCPRRIAKTSEGGMFAGKAAAIVDTAVIPSQIRKQAN